MGLMFVEVLSDGEKTVMLVKKSELEARGANDCARFLESGQVDEIHVTWRGKARLRVLPFTKAKGNKKLKPGRLIVY